MERTLYNGLISGVSLDGKTFFYPNPLESNGQHSAQPWFGVACCPGNITRFLASVPGYVYAQRRATRIYVNLFVERHRGHRLTDNGRTVKMVQDTRYPWDGAVRITVEPDSRGTLPIEVARSRVGAQRARAERSVSFHADTTDEQPVIRVNGERRASGR